MSDYLDKFNLKFEDLNAAERDTYMQMLQSLQNQTLTAGSIKTYIQQMKDAVEADLVGFTEPKSIWDFLFRRKRQLYLTARLRNYMLLMSFLTGPEKAKAALERSLSNIKSK